MTINNVLFIFTATTLFSVHSAHTLDTAEESRQNEQWIRELTERHSNQSRDPEKTPTTPDIIEHQPSMFKGRQRFFERKRIYFGIDAFDQPCYATIWQHAANNPTFGDVKLVIFKGYSKLEKLTKKYKPLDQHFKIIGTYSNTNKHQQLKKIITKYGGVWCPEQNAIIAGTRDKNIGKLFAEFEKQYANQPASKIFKK